MALWFCFWFWLWRWARVCSHYLFVNCVRCIVTIFDLTLTLILTLHRWVVYKWLRWLAYEVVCVLFFFFFFFSYTYERHVRTAARKLILWRPLELYTVLRIRMRLNKRYIRISLCSHTKMTASIVNAFNGKMIFFFSFGFLCYWYCLSTHTTLTSCAPHHKIHIQFIPFHFIAVMTLKTQTAL